jgi:hypothetical protein
VDLTGQERLKNSWKIIGGQGPKTHHSEGFVSPKVRAQKKRLLILDAPEHVDSENIKLKIGSRTFLY